MCRNASHETSALPDFNALVLRLSFEKRRTFRSRLLIIFALQDLYVLNPLAADKKASIGHHWKPSKTERLQRTNVKLHARPGRCISNNTMRFAPKGPCI